MYVHNKGFKSLFFVTLWTSFHRNNLTMLLPHNKRKKGSLMKFPAFVEVKLNGYMSGGKRKYHSMRKTLTWSTEQGKKWTLLLKTVTEIIQPTENCKILLLHSCSWRFKSTGWGHPLSTSKQLPGFRNTLVPSHLQDTVVNTLLGLLGLKDEGTKVLRNVGNYLPIETA
jgi:hypothetical protein